MVHSLSGRVERVKRNAGRIGRNVRHTEHSLFCGNKRYDVVVAAAAADIWEWWRNRLVSTRGPLLRNSGCLAQFKGIKGCINL